MTELSTMLAGIPFPSCLMNASGAQPGTHEELRDLAAEVGHAGELLRRHRIDVCVCHRPQLAALCWRSIGRLTSSPWGTCQMATMPKARCVRAPRRCRSAAH